MMTRKQHVDYWLHGASENMKDMRAALKSKRRVNAMLPNNEPDKQKLIK